MAQISGKFFSYEQGGFLTVSSLFADVYQKMTDNGRGFEVVNISHAGTSDTQNAALGWSGGPVYDPVAERYATAENIPGSLIGTAVGAGFVPEPWVFSATVRAVPTTPLAGASKPGDKLFFKKTDVPPIKINGIDQGEVYVVVTKTITKANGKVWSASDVTSLLTTPPADVYEVSDLMNGSIGISGTDYPIVSGNASLVSTGIVAGATPPGGFNVDSTDPSGQTYIYNLFTEGTTKGTASTTASSVKVAVDVKNIPKQFSFTLEAGPDADPNNYGSTNDQPWRVQFLVTGEQQASGSVATPLQMAYDPNLGRVSIAKITDENGSVVDNVGTLGAWEPDGVFTQSDFRQGFVNRTQRVADQGRTYPLSYILTITNRGFFLGIWEGNWSTQLANAGYPNNYASNFFNWLLVQRPVDRNNGAVLITGKAPVFAINGVDYNYYKAVVREADVQHPSSGPTLQGGTGKLIVSSKPPYAVYGNIDLSTNLMSNFLEELEIGSSIWDQDTNMYVGTIGSIFDGRTAFLDGKPPQEVIKKLDLINNWTASRKSSILTSNIANVAVTDGTALVNFNYIGPNQTPYRIYADRHSDGSHMLFNSQNQVALTEDKTYLLTFPHNLTTPRFRYTEELDMMGTTSSDVVRTGQDIQFTTYGEWGPRTYRALPGSNTNNTGLRVAVLRAPQGPRLIGVQTIVDDPLTSTVGNIGKAVHNFDPVSGFWMGDPDPTTGIQLPVVEPLPPGGNLSAAGWGTTNAPMGSRPAPVYGDQVWNAATGNVTIVGRPIPAAWPMGGLSHGTNITFDITRNAAQIAALGLRIHPSTGEFGAETGDVIQNVGFVQDTIIPFTVTITNDATDSEVPLGRNDVDLYILYKPQL